ncbi:NAD-P-binding protein [Mycena vulgaris]|nr:NAD-P-binding protein [Mycena vulgaris]
MSLAIFSFSTTAEEVATAFADEIKGKTVLITGTSVNGLGFETARVLAKHAKLVIITGHNSERLKLTEETIKQEVPSANLRPLMLDLSSLAAVRKAAGEVNAYPEPLHVLIHNAAAPVGAFKLTVDNLENQIATDHIGPFLFTKLLAPKILATRTAHYTPRVVFVSSNGHAFGSGVNFSTIGSPDPTNYDPMETYSQAKAANVLSAIELSKRSRGWINSYSLDPGAIYTNIMQRAEIVPVLQTMGILGPDGLPSSDNLTFKTIPQGAATTVAAAFDPGLSDKPGAYLSDCTTANHLIAPSSSDPANAEKLWTVTESIIGETFSFDERSL